MKIDDVAPPLQVLRLPDYRRIWVASVLMTAGTWVERLVVGWFVLAATNSPFATAAAFALRQACAALAAPIGGGVSDRLPRHRVLLVTALYRTAILLVLGLLTGREAGLAWVLLAAAAAGIATGFEVPSVQGSITDSVPPRLAMQAVATQSIGTRMVGALGALASGVVIAALGVGAALAGGALLVAAGGLVAGLGRAERTRRDAPRAPFAREVASGLAQVVRIPRVRWLLSSAIVVEICGFSYSAILPVVARDVLAVGEVGLGTLTMMSGWGAVAGVTALAMLADVRRKGLLLVGVVAAFGVGLAAFGVAPGFGAALAVVFVVGACAAAFDALEWTILQASVPSGMRGRVISGWVFAIGFGWIGHLALGAAASGVGVRAALLGAAGALLVAAVALAVSPVIRDS